MIARIFLLTLGLALAAGCARLGQELERVPLPPGAPDEAAILRDLAENDAAIAQFRATGVFTVKLPELDTVHNLPQSSIAYRRPTDLFVVGRRHATNVLELSAVEPVYLIFLPTEREYIYETEGGRVAGVSDRVSPVTLVRELFFPEDWAALPPDRLRLTHFDAETETAVMEIWTAPRGGVLRREVEVTGRPWHVVRSVLYDDYGQVVAETRKDDYRVIDDVLFPAWVEAAFPGEDAFMRLNLRRIFVNADIEPGAFDVEAKRAELNRRGIPRVRPDLERNP